MLNKHTKIYLADGIEMTFQQDGCLIKQKKESHKLSS